MEGQVVKIGAGMIPSTKEGQRQDFGDKNTLGDNKGDKKGLDANMKGDKSKAKKEKEATGVIKKKKNK